MKDFIHVLLYTYVHINIPVKLLYRNPQYVSVLHSKQSLRCWTLSQQPGFNFCWHRYYVTDAVRKDIKPKLLPCAILHGHVSCAGSGVVRIDPLRFLARCRKRRLNQV